MQAMSVELQAISRTNGDITVDHNTDIDCNYGGRQQCSSCRFYACVCVTAAGSCKVSCGPHHDHDAHVQHHSTWLQHLPWLVHMHVGGCADRHTDRCCKLLACWPVGQTA